MKRIGRARTTSAGCSRGRTGAVCGATSGRASRAPGPSRSSRGNGVPQVVIGHRPGETARRRTAARAAGRPGSSRPAARCRAGATRRCCSAEPVADAGAAAVVVRRPDRAGLALGVGSHAPELDDPEPSPSLADPFLRVEDRPARGHKDGQRRPAGEERRSRIRRAGRRSSKSASRFATRAAANVRRERVGTASR